MLGWTDLKWFFTIFRLSLFPVCTTLARLTVLLTMGAFVCKGITDVIFSCRQLAKMSLAKSLFMPAYKGACEPIPPCPSVFGSLPLPYALKSSNVFFTQLCATLCVQACVAFPLSCVQSQQQHTHTFLRPSGLGLIRSCCFVALLLIDRTY